MSDNPIKVGGAYVEDENHVPNPTDMVSQYNTEGVGAHGKIEEVSPIFEVDKVKTAQEILGALDPDNANVSSDRVLLPNPVDDNEVAKDLITEAAKARVEQGVVIGEATPAEREAEKEGEEGEQAAVEQERANAASNSTGNREAGQHSDAAGSPVATGTSSATTEPTGQGGGSEATSTSKTGDTTTASDKGDGDKPAAKKTAAKKTASSDKS